MTRPAVARLALVTGLIVLLEAACRLGAIERLTLIPPSEMAAELARLLGSGALNADLAATLSNVVAAFVLAVSGGFGAGLLIHAVPRLRRLLDPLLTTWYALPFFVFYPIFIVLFGMNRVPIVMMGALFAVGAMIVNTLNGLDRIPPVLTKTARVLRLGPAAAAWRIKLPCAAPYLFTGLKLAVAYSFVGVIAAEFILASSGLGYSIAYAYNNFDNPRMYALMLLVIALVTLVNTRLHHWERRLLERRGLA